MRRTALVVLAMLAAGPCFAATLPKPAPAATQPSAQINSEKTSTIDALAVFVNCLHYGDDISAVRAWAERSGLQEAPAGLAKPYLMGKPGKVYGGSTDTGDIVVASRDNGSCTVFASNALGNGLIHVFEAWLKQNNFAFKEPKPVTRKTKSGFETVSRDYSIRGEGGRWHALITLAPPGKARFEAIMTAYRNTKRD